MAVEKETYYLGEIGRVITIQTGIDWTGASTKAVTIIKPSGATLQYTAANVLVDDAANGVIHIVTTTGQLDQTGEYLIQAKCVTASSTLFSPITSFLVEDVLVHVV